jgi:hypothetical protein
MGTFSVSLEVQCCGEGVAGRSKPEKSHIHGLNRGQVLHCGPRRPQSGQITCYLNRTYHVLTTSWISALLLPS